MASGPSHDAILAANEATYVAWNDHDADGVAAVFAADAVVRDLGSPEPEARGRDAVRDRVLGLLAAFPDLRLERLDLVIGDHANADRWRMTGTHRGELFGIPATGNAVSVEGMTFSRFGDDGLVVDDTNCWDVPALLAQLGAAADETA
jgi:steroid delta-isomerase-like uncharacterized protein